MDDATLKQVREGIRKMERLVKTQETDIANARAAGIDVTDLEKQLNDNRLQLARFRQVYGE